MGYFNSGMGFDGYGNWNPLSDLNWIENGKYDTALYEVDITTGEATRLGIIEDRYLFAYMWVDGEEEPELPAGLRGDVDGDGGINVNDLTLLVDYLLSHNSTGIDLGNADCDLNTEVTISDATALIDYLLSTEW